jgi:signal peptidase I
LTHTTATIERPVGAAARAPEDKETALEPLYSICSVLAVGLFVMTFVFKNFEIPSGSMENALLIGDHLMVDRTTLAPPAPWAPFVHHREVHRGDVIVFFKPHPETSDLILVKRAIAVPGDHVHLRQGIVYLNGVPQDEPYAIMPTESNYLSYRDEFPSNLAGLRREASDDLAARGECQDEQCREQEAIDNRTIVWADMLPQFIQGDDLVVPPGYVFAMGDNRAHSLDGRFWGFVPRENILGRPMFVYWSFQTPSDQMDKTSFADRVSFMGHILLHIFDQTRWSRTFHIVR